MLLCLNNYLSTLHHLHVLGHFDTERVRKVYDSHFPLQSSSITQHAKKVVSNSPGLVDFAIGLEMSLFLTCPTGKCGFLGKFRLQKDCNQSR